MKKSFEQIENLGFFLERYQYFQLLANEFAVQFFSLPYDRFLYVESSRVVVRQTISK